MRCIKLLITLVVFINAFPKNNPSQSSMLDVVSRWNKLTILSLRRQLMLSTNKTDTKGYKDRLSAIPIRLSSNENINSTKPLRFDLLSDILKRGHRNFYIVEANRSGEKVEIVSYLVIITRKSAAILTYDWLDGKWAADTRYQECLLKFDTDLRKEVVKSGNGVNESDVTISKFVNGTPLASEYYLDHTLSANSGIDKVLEMRSTNRKY